MARMQRRYEKKGRKIKKSLGAGCCWFVLGCGCSLLVGCLVVCWLLNSVEDGCHTPF